MLGLVITVGTAWVAGYRGVPLGLIPGAHGVFHGPMNQHGSLLNWPEHDCIRIPTHPSYRYMPLEKRAPPGWAEVGPYPIPAGQGLVSLEIFAYGWPLRCLCAQRLVHSAFTRDGVDTLVFFSCWPITRTFADTRADRLLPRRVYWPGLLANTAFWSVISLGLILGLARTGRTLKRWRLGPGRCGRCGYDTRGLAICPECGRAASAIPAP